MADATLIPPELAQQWAGVRMAHEAMMLDDADKLLKQNREQIAAHYKAMGLETQPEEPSVIHVGNVTNNHAAPVAAAPPPAAQPATSGLGTLAKFGVGAALLGSGAAVPLAINALWPEDKPAVVSTFDPSKWEIIIPQDKK